MVVNATSATGAQWRSEEGEPRLAAGLMEATGMPQALANILAGRGITQEEVASWLEPKIRDLMPDPFSLADMEAAVIRLGAAVKAGEKIGIFSDYDVDGACSAALLYEVLTALGAEVHIHIPDRIEEGYGPNLPAILKLKEEGCSLVITADCGVSAQDELEAATEAGVEVIVIDHHLPGPDLPKVVAVVNPNRLDNDTNELGHLAAAGVVFLVLVALLRHLRESDSFNEPDLMRMLDLVALATVADVVPLTGLNRAFVRSGLSVMAKRERIGLAALMDEASLSKAPDVHALGFILGPRINAGGRIGDSHLGVSLLISRDKIEARSLAEELGRLNDERRAIEKQVVSAAISATEKAMKSEGDKMAFVLAMDEGWHEGVIGIAASRLKEHFNRPVAVVSLAKDKDKRMIGKGSGRSLAPFKLGEAVLKATQKGLLESGGGHDMAAGFTLLAEKADAFARFMNKSAMEAFGGLPRLEYCYASRLSAGHCDLALLDWLERASPWGFGFPTPYFCLEDVRLKWMKAMGDDGSHRRFSVVDGTGRVDGVAFGVAGTPLAGALDEARDKRLVHVLGRLERNSYQGRDKPQFILSDLAFA